MSSNSLAFSKMTRSIEEKLRDLIEAEEFMGVYISDEYIEKASEWIRIDAVSSTSAEKTSQFEERDYIVEITHYFRMNDPLSRSKQTKDRVDRLIQLLNNNQTSNFWANLTVDSVEYNIEADSESMSATQLSLTINNLNIWGS